MDAGEALQFPGRTDDLPTSQADVQLHDFVTRAIAGVLQGEGRAYVSDGQIAVRESGVAQAEAERKTDFLLRGGGIAVAHIEALAVFGGVFRAGIIPADGQIGVGHREGLRQLSAGIDLTSDDILHRRRSRLTTQAAVHEGLTAVDPGHLHRAARAQDHDDMGIDLMNLLQQVDLILGQTHVSTIKTLGLEGLRQTDIHQHTIGILRQGDGLGFQLCIGFILTIKALGIADVLREITRKQSYSTLYTLGVDHAAACALIAGLVGEIADDSHLRILRQGQDVALVPQQHDGLFSRFQRLPVLLLHIHRSATALGQGQHHVQQLGYALIDLLLGDTAFLEGLQQLAGAVVTGSGHFQVHTGPDALDVDVAAAPVGHDQALPAPFTAKNVLQQMLILVGIGAVQPVVGGHDRAGLSFLDGDLEIGQVHLPQGAFVHHGVGGHAQHLLAVGSEMLGTGRNALLLHAPDETGSHLACEVGILRVVLEGSSAQAAALGVQAGAKKHLHVLRPGVLADNAAQLLGDGLIPAVGVSRGRGNAGRLRRGVQAQVIALARLLAKTAGAIGERDGGDVQPFNGMGMPDVTA